MGYPWTAAPSLALSRSVDNHVTHVEDPTGVVKHDPLGLPLPRPW